MARTRNPFSRIVASKNDAEAAAAAAKAAAEKQLAESNTITHQGPGTGKAAPADPAAGSEILKRARDEAAEDSATATTTTKTAAEAAIRDAIQDAKDAAAQDPFDGIAAGRIPGAQETPTAVTDNDAESGGGESFGLSDLGLGRQGEGIAIDDGADSGVETLTDNPFRDQIKGAGSDGLRGGVSAGGSGGGNQAARDNLQSEIDSARGNEQDVASDLLGKPDLTPGAGNDGSGQRLFDLQVASANAAIAGASAVASGPSVASGSDPLGNAVNSVTEADKAAAAAKAGVTPSTAGSGSSSTAGSGSSSPTDAPPPAGPAPSGSEPADDGVPEQGFVSELVANGPVAAVTEFLKGFGDASTGNANANAIGREAGGDADLGNTGRSTVLDEQNKLGINNLETAVGGALGSAGNKGGVKDPGPEGEQQRPPTPEEFALQQAIRAELGLVRIAGDIDFGEGDGTNSGTASSANLSAVDNIKLGGNESLVGNPGSADAPTGGPVGTGSPGFGGSDQGGDIDFEDGSGFTGGTRTEDPNDISFGPSTPVAGFPSRDDEDDDSSSSTTLTTRFTRTARDSDDDD